MNINQTILRTNVLLISFTVSFAGVISAQGKKTPSVKPQEDGGTVYAASDLASSTPLARPADVASPEALLAALHDSVSGPQGPVDWDRFRSLFLPSARLGSTRTDVNGVTRITSSTVEELISSGAAEREKVPWYEEILVKHLERFDHIAVAFYSHDDRSSLQGPPIQQSVNVCVMLYDGSRWWIQSASWEAVPKFRSLPPELDPRVHTR
ncbi:hypothetical protein [Granulicella sp. L60]|uniref:hypothetical protein n=1 Tax=Granulicella sp. L60 TaxID=1641866 RepID=UPI00131C78CC|nr:hypothetical protein [Granulicella sp. L60]